MTGSHVTRPSPELPDEPRFALVVATARYADPALRQLRAPARDADQLSEVLADPRIGGFAVTRMVDRTAQEIRLAAEEFLTGRDPDDLLLVYLSCHGLVDVRRKLYFAATDTVKSRLAATGVESQWLLDLLEDCRARRLVVILDCCFSGAFSHGLKGDEDLALGERLHGQGRGRVVLTASRGSEYSWEGEPLSGAEPPGSVFTTAIVEGIRTGAADEDHDGYISVDDAYTFAFDRIRAGGSQQTPQRWLYGAEGKILLARSPAGVAITPAPLPEALRSGLDSPHPAIRLGAVTALGEWLTGDDPARALAARRTLQEVAETDIPMVASAARALLGRAEPEPEPEAEELPKPEREAEELPGPVWEAEELPGPVPEAEEPPKPEPEAEEPPGQPPKPEPEAEEPPKPEPEAEEPPGQPPKPEPEAEEPPPLRMPEPEPGLAAPVPGLPTGEPVPREPRPEPAVPAPEVRPPADAVALRPSPPVPGPEAQPPPGIAAVAPEGRARVVPPPPPVRDEGEFAALAQDLVSPPPVSPPPVSPPPTESEGPPEGVPPGQRIRLLPHGRRARAFVLGVLLLVVATVATVVFTTRSGTPPPQATTGTPTKPGVVPAVSADPALAALVPAAVRSSGKLVVATAAGDAAAEYTDSQGNLFGWDIDLARAIAQKLGLTPDVRNVTFESIIPGITSETYQLGMSSFNDNKEREATVDMVDYFTGGTAVAVQNGNPAKVDPKNLCGVKVAVQTGTTQADEIKGTINPDCANAGKPPVPNDGDKFDGQAGVINAVISGHDQAMLADSAFIDYASMDKRGQLMKLGDTQNSAPYGIVLAKGSTLTKAVQGAVQSLIDDGNYGQILTKWGVQAGAVRQARVDGATT